MIRLAIIGTGKIVTEALYAMDAVESIRKQAIFARPHSIEKARAFAAQYAIPEVYTDYRALLAKADVNTVYIGLVNSVHYAYAKEALESGKNVILEKPFVLSSKEAEELRDIAQEKNVFIFEAITVLHNAVFNEMKKNLAKLGTLRMVLCNYSQYSSRYDAYLEGRVSPAFDPKMQAGAANDLDVYNIHYCVGLFGMPEKVSYFPNRGFNGIDTSGALVMTYPGFICVCTAAKDSDSPCFVSVQGEKGWMKIDGKPNAANNLTTVCVDMENPGTERDASGAQVRRFVRDDYKAPEVRHRMTEEFADFAEIIENEDRARADEYLKETISVVRVLELAHISA